MANVDRDPVDGVGPPVYNGPIESDSAQKNKRKKPAGYTIPSIDPLPTTPAASGDIDPFDDLLNQLDPRP